MMERGGKVGRHAERGQSSDAAAGAAPVPGKHSLAPSGAAPAISESPQREPGAPSSPAPQLPSYASIQRLFGDRAQGATDGKHVHARAVVASTAEATTDDPAATKNDSARFGNDAALDQVSHGAAEVKQGDRGVLVTKLQQALVDLGYLFPRFGVDGKFGPETRAAVIKFQTDQSLPGTGKLDKDTLERLDTIYDTRKPYIDAARHDPAKPGTRTLSAADKAAAIDAMVPRPGAGGAPAVFTRVTPDGKDYGDEIRDALTSIIQGLHKDLYEDKVGLRADPAKNLHDWSVMEGPPKASKQVTDALYASNYGGPAAFPAMTHAGGNLIDQWTDEESRNSLLSDPQKTAKAREKVEYLIDSNCDTVNAKHGAVASNPTEKAILKPIIDSFVSDKTKVQTLLDLDIGWEGAQLEGVVYLQRYKSQDPDKDKAKEQNRVQMWDLFQTCIHEYIHTLAHPAYQAWAQQFSRAGDNTRYNTLIEGFCDFFTLNVRKAMTVDAPTAAQIEGPYANGNPPPPDRSGVYPSHAQAEQVVSVVGIKNAQAGYFGGQTKLMGAA